MARVTVEDCIEKVTNRFDLVMYAAQRAREISAGAPLAVERDNDKNPVIALREIAGEQAKPDTLEQALVQGLQKRVDFDEFEDDEDLDGPEDELLAKIQSGAPLAAVADVPPAVDEANSDEAKADEASPAEAAPEATDEPSAEEGA